MEESGEQLDPTLDARGLGYSPRRTLTDHTMLMLTAVLMPIAY
jgi:hypothetical protein